MDRDVSILSSDDFDIDVNEFSQSVLRQVLEVRDHHPGIVKAAAENSMEDVVGLIAEGCDVNEETNLGFTALTFAAHRGHVDVFRLLLKHGADWRGGRLPSWKSRFPIPGLIMTALHVCALVDNSVCLGVLIKDGADLNYQPAPTLTTCLHFAAGTGAVGCVRLLLSCNADINIRNHKGNTALHFVCRRLMDVTKGTEVVAKLEVLNMLVRAAGMKLDIRNTYGRTALHIAAAVDSFQAVRCLVEAGANLAIEDKDGFTPANSPNIVIPAIKEYLQLCQGHVQGVGAKADDTADAATSCQAVASLVSPDIGTTLATGKFSCWTSKQQETEAVASAVVKTETVPSDMLQSGTASQLFIPPGALDKKTYFRLQDLSSLPVIAVEDDVRKKGSKKEKKAARKAQKNVLKSLVPIEGMAITSTQRRHHIHAIQCTEPVEPVSPSSTRTGEFAVSPITTLVSNRELIMHQPAKLTLHHSARPPNTCDQSHTVSCPYRITVKQQSLTEDGSDLTDWKTISVQDIESSGNSITLSLRKIPLFSAFVAVVKYMKGRITDWMCKELEFRVVGSQYYSKVSQPLVVCITNGSCFEASSRQVDFSKQLVQWGPPHSVKVPVNEDVTVKINIEEAGWTVTPLKQRFQRRILTSSRGVHTVSFAVTAPTSEVRAVACMCAVQVPGEDKPLEIPFSIPTLLPATVQVLPSVTPPASDISSKVERLILSEKECQTRLLETGIENVSEDSFISLYHRLPLDNPVCQQDVDVVVTLACGKWRQFGRALGFSLSRTEDIVSCHSQIRDSEKLQMIISEWKAESGEKATIGKLLKACDHEAVQVMRSVVVELAKLNQAQGGLVAEARFNTS